jgi:leucyl aminopeptidase
MLLPINLVTLVAAAENMPSGIASRPGDVVRTLRANGRDPEHRCRGRLCCATR